MSLLVCVYAACVMLCCASTSCLACPEGLHGGKRGSFASHHFIHSGQHEPMARQHLAESGAQGLEHRDWAWGGVHEPRLIMREQSCPQHDGHRGLLGRRMALARQLQPLLGGRLLVKDLRSRKKANKQSNTDDHTTKHTHDHTTNHIRPHTYTHQQTTAHIRLHYTTTKDPTKPHAHSTRCTPATSYARRYAVL